jgi:hypothetical protein
MGISMATVTVMVIVMVTIMDIATTTTVTATAINTALKNCLELTPKSPTTLAKLC